MKKNALTFLLLVAAVGIAILPLGCQQSMPVVQTQYATVTRGDLSTDITASGNLAYLLTEDVDFEVSGTTDNPVTIKEVLVKVGQTVSKGQPLIKADESVLKTQVNDAEVTYKQAQLSYQQSQNSYKQQEYALETAKINLEKANKNLTDAQKQNTGKTLFTYYPNIYVIDENLEKALVAIDDMRSQLFEGNSFTALSVLDLLEPWLSTAEANASVSYTFAASEGSVSSAIAAYEALVDAQRTAQNSYTNAQKSLDSAKMSLDLAQASFERAQTTYEEKRQLLSKATLYAPFDGFVTAVPVRGGNTVTKGLVAATVADPNKYQASILVSEKDIDKVTVGTTGYVKVDTLAGQQFPAAVTEVSPTATVTSGVVNYSVTVGVTQKEPAKTTTSDSGVTVVDLTGKLRQGQTITVTLQTNKRTGVLLVPKGAVITRGGQSYVNLVQADGTTVEKAIKTGVSNTQSIEVTSGLSEGEKLALASAAGSAAASTARSTPTATSRSTSAVAIPGLTGGAPPSGGGGPPPGS
jgi:multidrug efflux pump subunit AcrA (membrane-fusion protein)